MLFGYDESNKLITKKCTFNNYFFVDDDNISLLTDDKRITI